MSRQERAYWRAHNRRCLQVNREKYGGQPRQMIICVQLGKWFAYRAPLFTRRTAS